MISIAGLHRARRDGVAGDQAAAADRNDQHVEIGDILEHLERDRALAGDHVRVVIGMHPDELPLGRDRLGAHLRIGDGLAVEHDRRAVRLGRRDLHERRRHRHHDGRRNFQPLRVIGDRLGVVAGRHRDHAARALGGAQRRELRERAALLERVGDLQVLVFDEHLRAGQRGEFRRRQHRRAQHLGADGAPRRLDIGERDGHGDASWRIARARSAQLPSHRHQFLLASSCRLRNHLPVARPYANLRRAAVTTAGNGRIFMRKSLTGVLAALAFVGLALGAARAQDYPRAR